MTALQRFGFKMRKDGSMVYSDKEKAIRIHPTGTEVGQWGNSDA